MIMPNHIALAWDEINRLQDAARDLCKQRNIDPDETVRELYAPPSPYDMQHYATNWQNVACEIAIFMRNQKYLDDMTHLVETHKLGDE